MDYNKLDLIFSAIRRGFCPARIYKYGKVGLFVHDDRTIKEKIFDCIGDYITENKLKALHERSRKSSYFKRFFDYSSGIWINSVNDIKQHEKQNGFTYMSGSEHDREVKRIRAIKAQEWENEIHRDIENVVRDVKRGRKFTRENAEARAQIFRQHGIKA